MLNDMGNRYNFLHFEAEYRIYLGALNTKPVTIKNYLSDLRYFFSWLKSHFQVDGASYDELSSLLSKSAIAQFYTHIEREKTNESTVKRRISTIRSFVSFCVKQRWLTENTAKLIDTDKDITYKQQVIHEYVSYMRAHDHKQDIDSIKALISNFIMY